jgi:hypothetical protein
MKPLVSPSAAKSFKHDPMPKEQPSIVKKMSKLDLQENKNKGM